MPAVDCVAGVKIMLAPLVLAAPLKRQPVPGAGRRVVALPMLTLETACLSVMPPVAAVNAGITVAGTGTAADTTATPSIRTLTVSPATLTETTCGPLRRSG